MHTRHLLLSLLVSTSAFANVSNPMSPARDPRVPVEDYIDRAQGHEKVFGTALSMARLYDESSLAKATEWESTDVLNKNFETMRDDRFLGRNSDRRIPWLYPDDGCYARAALMNSWFIKHDIKVASKVFAFGKLSAKSEILDHKVFWWYHVAPIVEVKGEKYVLDPSVDPTAPMKLSAWLDAIGEPESIKVSICKPGTYLPKESCSDETVGIPATATTAELLDEEWALVKESGKDPQKVLGEEPPWENEE